MKSGKRWEVITEMWVNQQHDLLGVYSANKASNAHHLT